MGAGVMLLAGRPFSLIWALPNSGFGGDDWRGPVSAFPPFLTRPLRPEGMSKHEFKIGQSLIYRKGRTKEDGRYVVLAVLSQTRGEVRYRIRSQADEAREFVARESELASVAPHNKWKSPARPADDARQHAQGAYFCKSGGLSD